MRLKLTLNSDKEFIKLPLHYNTTIQGMIYKNLPKPLAKFLHDSGFFHNNRPFKLYTFSKIISPYYKIFNDIKTITFKTPITIYISSAIKEVAKSFGETFLNKEIINLDKNSLYIESIEVLAPINIKTSTFRVRTLSPITTYQTLEKENSKKFYRFYNPSDPMFNYLIKENIRRKYEVITSKNLEDFNFDIKPIDKVRKALIKYKDFTIEAYDGEFEINTDPEIFKTVYDAGLGAKNSQGFGMIEVING
ncbi:MAG: CRISPR-associated endoribonuclease Cas6 [Hydrogenothermaceae bacterium]|nr:CRISPR-associated endoribonuclease Cas6 [Hydrogenothermaceae bacterium]